MLEHPCLMSTKLHRVTAKNTEILIFNYCENLISLTLLLCLVYPIQKASFFFWDYSVIHFKLLQDVGYVLMMLHMMWPNKLSKAITLDSYTGSAIYESPTCCSFIILLKVNNSCTSLDRPWGFQEVKATRFHCSQHLRVVSLSALCTGCLYPPENIPDTHFC